MKVVSSYTIATVLSFQTLSTCIIFTLGQYIYTFYLQTYAFSLNGTSNLTTVAAYVQKIKNDSPGKCVKGSISLDSTAQAWAQQRSADLLFWTNLFN
jgi:hypothetical protein